MPIAKKNTRQSISLDRYMLFFHSRPFIDFRIPELNQIVSLHGFKKLQTKIIYQPDYFVVSLFIAIFGSQTASLTSTLGKFALMQKVLTEALGDLDLMDLSRSTIQERTTEISSSASITLEELVDDLNELDWQECCITSVEALYSQKGGNTSTAIHQATTDLSLTQPADTFPRPDSQSVSAFKKRKTTSAQTLYSTKEDATPKSLDATEPAKLKNQPTAAFKKRKPASVRSQSSKDDDAPIDLLLI